MIEQNSVAAEHVIRIAIFTDNPVSVLLCHCIRAVRVERCGLPLRDFFDAPEQFRRRCLIDSACVCKTAQAHSLQDPEDAQRIDVRCVLGNVKTHLYVALCRKVIDFVRLHFTDQLHETDGIRKIRIMQVKIRISLDVIDPLAIICG